MRPSTSLRPPSVAEARSNAVMLVRMGGFVLVPDAVLSAVQLATHGGTATPLFLALIPALVLLGLSRFMRRKQASLHWYGLPLAIFGLVLAWGLNVLTRDGSVGALAALMLPLIYAAHNLRMRWALAIVALSMLGQLHVCLIYDDQVGAVRNALMLLVVEMGLTWFIIHARIRQQRLQDDLRELALVDPLTGLATRRRLDDALRSELAAGTHELGLLMIDLDAFKDINDSHGHPVGDAALVMAAAQVRACAGPEDIGCRMGGDEFALLMVNCSRRETVLRAERILAAVGALRVPVPGGGQVPLSVSIGLAHSRDVGDLPGLYHAADNSLYSAKRSGRNRIGSR